MSQVKTSGRERALNIAINTIAITSAITFPVSIFLILATRHKDLGASLLRTGFAGLVFTFSNSILLASIKKHQEDKCKNLFKLSSALFGYLGGGYSITGLILYWAWANNQSDTARNILAYTFATTAGTGMTLATIGYFKGRHTKTEESSSLLNNQVVQLQVN